MKEQLENIQEYIESDELSPEQRKICYQTGNFVVRACPGSGKTRTVGTRFAWRMADWKSRRFGIATISFTNVAYEEISHQLEILGFPPRPHWPHFLGTIDSFVNQFIFSPFGHIVMEINRRPEIVHENNRAWIKKNMHSRSLGYCYQKGCDSTCFQFKANDSLEYCGVHQPNCQREKCVDVKDVMVKRGFALPTDAMYWALKILKIPQIRDAIVKRFPEIIVDEAQDTSETQVGIIRILEDAGCTIALIGDLDQAIYSFNGARPDLFQEFENEWKSLPLSANFRSSQYICNATYLFSGLSKPAEAAGRDKDFPIEPLIIKYTIGQENSLIEIFRSLLDKYSIEPGNSAILTRTHDMVTKISGRTSIDWPRGVTFLSKCFAIAATYRDESDLMISEAHQKIMWALLRLCFNTGSYGPNNEAIHEIGYRQWRRESWKLLQNLPSSDTPLSEWGVKTKPIIEKFISELGWQCNVTLSMTFKRCNDPTATNQVSRFVNLPVDSQNQIITVIHQAKGKSYDAVIVVCGPNRGRRRADLEQWLNPRQENEKDERRVGYVAMTRARKLLILAVPNNASEDLLNKLNSFFQY